MDLRRTVLCLNSVRLSIGGIEHIIAMDLALFIAGNE
jgi:hypothetical protein